MSCVAQLPCLRGHAILQEREAQAVGGAAPAAAVAVATAARVGAGPARAGGLGDQAEDQGAGVAMAELEVGVLAEEVAKAAVAGRIRQGCSQCIDYRRQRCRVQGVTLGPQNTCRTYRVSSDRSHALDGSSWQCFLLCQAASCTGPTR